MMKKWPTQEKIDRARRWAAALTVAEVILNGKKQIQTACGRKYARGLADLIIREVVNPFDGKGR